MDPARGTGSPLNKPKLRADKDLKALSLRGSVSGSLGLVPASSMVAGPRDSANSASIQRNSSFRSSWKVYMVSTYMCFSDAEEMSGE